jgi:hypothetical protein
LIAPAFVGVDFERAFYAQVATHFTEAEIIGCLFHFKQALHRRMAKHGISNEEVKFCMRKDIIDLITVPRRCPESQGGKFHCCNDL